jgi:hypothetical protein
LVHYCFLSFGNSFSNALLKFLPKIYPESYSQKFAYLLSEDGICLFKPNSNYSVILKRDSNTNVFSFANYTPNPKDKLPSTAFLKFISYKHKPLKRADINDGHLTKYTVNKLDYQQELIPDSDYNSSKYFQNFLGMFPVESPRIENDVAVYDLQIHGLKNYQTPEYNYSYNNNFIEGYSGVRRSYDRIFSGTNQKEGLSNVHLGYSANSSEITFPLWSLVQLYWVSVQRRGPRVFYGTSLLAC